MIRSKPNALVWVPEFNAKCRDWRKFGDRIGSSHRRYLLRIGDSGAASSPDVDDTLAHFAIRTTTINRARLSLCNRNYVQLNCVSLQGLHSEINRLVGLSVYEFLYVII